MPYRLLVQQASVAPAGGLAEFVLKRLDSYGMVREGSAALSARIGWASKWAKRGGERVADIPHLPQGVRRALEQFANALADAEDGDAVQNAAFEALKNNGLKPSEFFPAVYAILLGSDRGPRLGPYVIDAGRDVVSRALLRAAAS